MYVFESERIFFILSLYSDKSKAVAFPLSALVNKISGFSLINLKK